MHVPEVLQDAESERVHVTTGLEVRRVGLVELVERGEQPGVPTTWLQDPRCRFLAVGAARGLLRQPGSLTEPARQPLGDRRRGKTHADRGALAGEFARADRPERGRESGLDLAPHREVQRLDRSQQGPGRAGQVGAGQAEPGLRQRLGVLAGQGRTHRHRVVHGRGAVGVDARGQRAVGDPAHLVHPTGADEDGHGFDERPGVARPRLRRELEDARVEVRRGPRCVEAASRAAASNRSTASTSPGPAPARRWSATSSGGAPPASRIRAASRCSTQRAEAGRSSYTACQSRSWANASRSPSSTRSPASSSSRIAGVSAETDLPSIALTAGMENLRPNTAPTSSSRDASGPSPANRLRALSLSPGGNSVRASSARNPDSATPLRAAAWTASTTRNGLPSARWAKSSNDWFGGEPIRSSTSASEASGRSRPRLTTRGSAAVSLSTSASTSGRDGERRRASSHATGMAVTWAARAPTAHSVAESAHCRSSSTTRTGRSPACFSRADRNLSSSQNRWSASSDRPAMSAGVTTGGSLSRKASSSVDIGATPPSWLARPLTTRNPSPAATAAASASNRDLPIPATPSTRATSPRPSTTRPSQCWRATSSWSRPRSRVDTDDPWWRITPGPDGR